MRKYKFALLALGAGFMFQGAAVQPASALQVPKQITAEKQGVTQVRHRGGRHFGVRHYGGRHFGGRHYGRHYGFRRHYYRPRFYAAPVYSYHHGSCRWLKRKALWTGSSYWWHRYNRCRYGW